MTLDPSDGVGDEHGVITVGQLRDVIGHLPDETPLMVAVRDRHHFDTFLAEVAVIGVEVTRGPSSPVVVFDAAGIS